MVARSKKELGTPAIGQTVAVPISTFDRGKGDSRNLLGRIYIFYSFGTSFPICFSGERQRKCSYWYAIWTT
jgi:hypothetical protein